MKEGVRNDRRYKSSHPLLVRCDSWNDFVQLYAGDISQGGMFVITDEPPEILSYIQVQMALPERQQLVLKARVVHVMSKELAEAEGKQAGVGVEFQDLSKSERQQIQQMIEFARWEGDSGNPIASYANHMFEMSSQKSTAEILAEMPADKKASGPSTPQSSKPPRKKEPTQRNPAVKRNTQRVRKVGSPADMAAPATSARPAAGPDRSRASQLPSDPDRSMAGPLPTSDPAKIKVAMTHIARKRFDEALATLKEILDQEPQDLAARKWSGVARARRHLANKEAKKALKEYEAVLVVDESHREARDFVRNFHREKRLKAIPFGRYFVKKKR